MTREQRWLLPSACVAVIVTGLGSMGTSGAIAGLMICVAGAVPMLVDRGRASGPSGARFAARLLIGSLLAGCAFCLMFAVVMPPPGLLNLVWVLGIPLVIGLLVHPRKMGLALALPVAVGGFLWFLITALILGIPLD